MGTGNSSLPVNQNRTWSVEPPPLPAPPFFTSPSSETSTITRDIEDATENATIKTSTSAFDGPLSQGPSPYTTLRRKGCWQHEATSPRSSNTHSRQDSLLTYAPEIVGWPPNGRMATEMQQERIELTRTVSHLAAATQQLASAQNVTLMHLETIYDELRREREIKKGADFPHRRFNCRVANSESATNERLTSINQRKIQRTLDSDLRNHLDNAVAQNSSDSNEEEIFENVYDSDDRGDLTSKLSPESYAEYYKSRDFKKSRHIRNPGKKSISSKMAWKFKKSDNADNSCCENAVVVGNDIEVQEEKILESDDGCPSSDRLVQEMAKFGTKKRPVEKNEQTVRPDVSFLNLENDNCAEAQETDVSKAQILNARLKTDLQTQQRVIEKLKEDYEVSRNEYKITEKSLAEQNDELSQLSRKLDLSKREIVRLLKELETFQYEKAATDSRISNLEKDLQERERMRKEELDENNCMHLRLLQELSDKNKYLNELEEAKEEIERLKQAIEADKETASITNPGTSRGDDSTINASVVGEEFKKELILKREARQRAIAAVSSEMERLRKELDAEKVAHSETSKILELLKAAQNEPSTTLVHIEESETQICNQCSDDITEKENDLKLSEEMLDEKTDGKEAMRLTDILKISEEVMNNIRFQLEKADDLFYQLNSVPEIHKNRILSLKKLADDMRETLKSRERQVSLLKDRLSQILVKLGDRTFLSIEEEISVESNRQLGDLRNLRRLYEERSKILTELKESTVRDLHDVKRELRALKDNNEILENDLRKAEEKLDVQDAENSNLESQLGLAKADCRDLQNQMSVINNLFTQMLLGASSADMDLDRLTQLLQENHDLISDMTRDSGTEAAALPKMLLDLIEQVEGTSKERRSIVDSENDEKKEDDDLQEENIAHNLPKVWRVLLELLRCHAAETSATSAASSSASECCYKSVDTPTGPQVVISVSKTYIRLKELILEKKHLEKEMNRMKQLNNHLEGKLVEQEKRLSTVSDELTKTWNIVGRMQAQHQQLHTHEKILRYELQQKRKMLQELKQELEYCREKWESARQKNTNTEIEWRSLRREFAARKALSHVDSLNNSAESGFSDGRDDESDEEVGHDESMGKRVRIHGSRRRSRKENSRPASPDTESEQPTDTEISESKTISSSTSEQQFPILDEEERTEGGTEEVLNIVTEESDTIVDMVLETETDIMDPLDRALTNVIRNLIKIDERSSPNNEDQREPDLSNFMKPGPSNSLDLTKSDKKKNLKRMAKDWTTTYDFDNDEASKVVYPTNENLPKETNCSRLTDEHEIVESNQSVFSIGPFPSKNSDVSISNTNGDKSLSILFGGSGSCSTTDCISSVQLGSEILKKTERGIESSVEDQPDQIVSLDNLQSSIQSIVKEDTSECQETSSSPQPLTTSTIRSPDEILSARAARLKRLEEQADWLVKKMNATSQRGSALSNRLEELHETYGSPPGPPPLPDVLPAFRLQAEIDSTSQTTHQSSTKVGPTQEKNDSQTSDDLL